MLSVISPFVGVGVGLIAEKAYKILHPTDQGEMDLSTIGFVFLPIFACLLGGTILSGISAIRREKWWGLGLLGFLLNAGPFLCTFIFRAFSR